MLSGPFERLATLDREGLPSGPFVLVSRGRRICARGRRADGARHAMALATSTPATPSAAQLAPTSARSAHPAGGDRPCAPPARSDDRGKRVADPGRRRCPTRASVITMTPSRPQLRLVEELGGADETVAAKSSDSIMPRMIAASAEQRPSLLRLGADAPAWCRSCARSAAAAARRGDAVVDPERAASGTGDRPAARSPDWSAAGPRCASRSAT